MQISIINEKAFGIKILELSLGILLQNVVVECRMYKPMYGDSTSSFSMRVLL